MSESSKAVFLSYASQDVDAAKKICDALRAIGVEVWFDAEGGLEHGDEWDAKIRRQIKECVLFIPLISANTQARHEGYFRIEWDLAAERARGIASGVAFILPVVIDDTREPDALVPDRFRTVQWTKLPGGAVPPDVRARFLKLWTQRTGGSAPATTHETAPPYHKPRRWIVPVIIGTVVVTVGAVVWFVRDAAPKPGGEARAAAAPSPAPEDARLVAQVWKLLYDHGMARAQLDGADQLCRRASEIAPTNPEVWAAWAHVNTWFVFHRFDDSSSRREAARVCAERAMQLAPESFEARLAQAMYWLRGRTANQAQSDMAEEILFTLRKERPDDIRVPLFLGTRLIRSGRDPDAGRRMLEQLGENTSLAAVAWMELGWRNAIDGHYAEAETFADRSVAAGPYWNNIALKVELALAWHGDVTEAKEWMAKMPPADMQEDVSVFEEYYVGMWSRKPGQVIGLLNAHPRDWLNSSFFYGPKQLLLGQARLMAGQQEAAQRDLRRAVELIDARLEDDPNNAWVLMRKAETLHFLGEQDAAIAAYRLSREIGWQPPSLNEQVLFEPPDKILDAIEAGFDTPTEFTTAASLRLNPRLDPLRDNPRFQALLARAEASPLHSPNPKPAVAQSDSGLLTTHSSSALSPSNGLPATDKSIAVLAFANLSDDKGNEYFSDGVSEELIDLLGRVPGLTVKGRTSAFLFKGKNASSAEIARQLGVSYLVRGSVQKAGDKVRITAQLTRAQTDEVVWSSEPLVRELTDIWSVQEEIAGLVASNLSLALGATPRGGRIHDPEAHRLYLEGRHDWSLRSLEGFARAEQALTKAVEIEPDSALLHAALADVFVMRSWYRVNFGLPPGDGFARGQTEADRAVDLGPDLAQVYEAPAALAFADRRWDEAERLIRKSLELAPNDAVAYNRLGDLMVERGRLDLGLENYQRALQLDPLSPYMVRDVVRLLYRARRYQEVIDAVARYEAVVPDDVRRHVWRAGAWLGQGKKGEAARELKALMPGLLAEENPVTYSAEAVLLLRQAGCEAEAGTLADDIARRFPAGSYLQPLLLLARGEIEQALPILQSLPPSTTDHLFWGVLFDSVRDDPRFLAWVAQQPCAAEYRVARENLAQMLRQQEVGP